jgi:hypothetical protein
MAFQSVAFVVLAIGTGCATPPPLDRVTIPGSAYDAAFDAAVETVRSKGWEPVIMDRRGGIIETSAVQTPSLLEPWAWKGTDAALATLNTLGNTRRRVRIEFSPTGPPPMTHDADAEIGSADLLGLHLDEDLMKRSGPIDARAWVWIERQYRPGRNLGSWTFKDTSWERPVIENAQWEHAPKRIAVPEGRDRGAERQLLAEISRRLSNS